MPSSAIAEAVTWLEKANADLQPELLSADAARDLLTSYARAEKLAAYGRTMLATKLDDATEMARTSGTSVGEARATLETAKTLENSDQVRDAFKTGSISLGQASEIAKAEAASPGAACELLPVANTESFQVLRERARKTVLEAEQHRDLAARQHAARSARSHIDDLGMIDIHLTLEPHVGTPIVNRAETEAARLHRHAIHNGSPEPFERHLADAYAKLLSHQGSARSRRPELVVLVSHEVIKRGWREVREAEVCKIPGVGPVAPQVAREIAKDAFLTGVFYDGEDLRHLCRWTRNIPIEVLLALELGVPPDFDGVACTDCGKRFRTEKDHVDPHVARGPASTANLKPRCYSCHQAKTERDRRAGMLTPRDPDAERGPP
jgi:hypothetical protein